ncbi:PRC-barrel domain-containing protein [Jannaschia rubra]|uniref:PRC-barrel domain protein n=1 Tax=Jannaschia rubra TaxID=282197 RepID=A0A0M6XNE3_9RHOB|nr:PRC-barrel domain-containing protein [Jannaschia rubra]CTQ32448.1 PRC-barrel domain protein [Jannaschia rubra]SFF82431.1 PRC-barrel domain-containing protein [Jannaschia rubra]
MSLRVSLSASALLLASSLAPAFAQDATTTDPAAPEAAAPEAATAAPEVAPADPAATDAPGAFADMPVADVIGQNVTTNAGDSVGEVESLVSAGGTIMAVLGVGGFLGLGEHKVAVPLTELAPAEGMLLLQALDREALEAMPEYDGMGEELPMDVTVSGEPVPEAVPADPAADPATAPTE